MTKLAWKLNLKLSKNILLFFQDLSIDKVSIDLSELFNVSQSFEIKEEKEEEEKEEEKIEKVPEINLKSCSSDSSFRPVWIWLKYLIVKKFYNYIRSQSKFSLLNLVLG